MKYSPYSHSRLDLFRSCPLKFKFQYIDKIKIPFEPNLALYRGSYFHECLEYDDSRPNFKTNNIFTEEQKAKVFVLVNVFRETKIWKDIINNAYINEQKFAFKVVQGEKGAVLEDCDYWDKTAWIRGAIDVHWWNGKKLVIKDYKSGKDKSTDDLYFSNDQMVTYAVWAFTKYPAIDEVTTAFVYIEHGTERFETFHRKDLPTLVKGLFSDTKACENGERYPKRISALCNFCAFKEFGHCSGEIDNTELPSFSGLVF